MRVQVHPAVHWIVRLVGAVAVIASCVTVGPGLPGPSPRITIVPGTSVALPAPDDASPPEPPPSVSSTPPPDGGPTTGSFPDSHDDLDLEAGLAIEINGVDLRTASFASDVALGGGAYLSILLSAVQRTADDLSTALAADPEGRVDGLLFAVRVRNVATADLLRAFLDVTGNPDAPEVRLGFREARQVQAEAASEGITSYVYASGDVVYVIQTDDQEVAADALSQLP